MGKFRIFLESQGQVKLLVMKALDPEESLDRDSLEILDMRLGDFADPQSLLQLPELVDMINDRPNRGAILKAIGNPDTTVGNIINMLQT